MTNFAPNEPNPDGAGSQIDLIGAKKKRQHRRLISGAERCYVRCGGRGGEAGAAPRARTVDLEEAREAAGGEVPVEAAVGGEVEQAAALPLPPRAAVHRRRAGDRALSPRARTRRNPSADGGRNGREEIGGNGRAWAGGAAGPAAGARSL